MCEHQFLLRLYDGIESRFSDSEVDALIIIPTLTYLESYTTHTNLLNNHFIFDCGYRWRPFLQKHNSQICFL